MKKMLAAIFITLCASQTVCAVPNFKQRLVGTFIKHVYTVNQDNRRFIQENSYDNLTNNDAWERYLEAFSRSALFQDATTNVRTSLIDWITSNNSDANYDETFEDYRERQVVNNRWNTFRNNFLRTLRN